MSNLKLYNTLTRKKEVFKPIKKDHVSFYSCGPTVYWFAHIGNLRTYVFNDTLKRILLYNGFNVKHIMNITDVGHLTSDSDEGEDKMTQGLIRENFPLTLEGMKKLADKYTKKFSEDLEKLNILAPDLMPRASENIKGDIELIKQLEKNGFIYKTSDGVYFDTSRLKDYGKLAGLKKEVDEEFSRVGVNPEKRNPRDFALWKFNKELGWISPWGMGFPGWHIECSVMSTKFLGQPFDIHTGGIDHIHIHHTNEIAQSEAAFDKKMANFWLHGAFLQVKGSRMGKSEGNIAILDNLIKQGIDPLSFRYLVLTSHYRSELNFTDKSIQSAQKTYFRLKELVKEFSKDDTELRKGMENYEKKFLKAINDDLNTPEALAVAWDLVRSDNPGSLKFHLIEKFDEVLGLKLTEFEEIEIPQEIQKLIREREKYRKGKNFKKSDEIRDKIKKKGFIVEDSEKGVRVKKV